MQAPDWYDDWCEAAFAAFQAKQQQITEAYRLGDWERYDYDANARTLTFSDAGVAKVKAEITVLGTTGETDFLWGWANPSWPMLSVAGLRPVHTFGIENGVEELTTDLLSGDDLDGLGWMLAAIAVRILDAKGAYRAPTPEGGAVFLILRSIEFVS